MVNKGKSKRTKHGKRTRSRNFNVSEKTCWPCGKQVHVFGSHIGESWL